VRDAALYIYAHVRELICSRPYVHVCVCMYVCAYVSVRTNRLFRLHEALASSSVIVDAFHHAHKMGARTPQHLFKKGLTLLCRRRDEVCTEVFDYVGGASFQ
jgi:hypothetical protein